MKNKATASSKKPGEKYDPSSIELKWSFDKAQDKQTKYNPSAIEPYWQSIWEQEKTYQPDMDTASPSINSGQAKPFYNLMMFPYPSAEGLHVGNMYAFTGADVYGRYQRMQGYNVFEPIGLDGFGIHSENYALKVGSHPMEQSAKSEKNFYRQLHAIGNGYDWTRTVETYKPDYYKWTQWVFVQLFKAGLAYQAEAQVNWCPSCKTVLADEQVIDGACERCGTVVEKRELKQWFFRITGYAEQLLQDLDTIDWTEKVKIAQRNWIGKSTGAAIRFQVKDVQAENKEAELEVFTTRPDTLYGATFMVISPEHPLVIEILHLTQDEKVKESLLKYIETTQSKTESERLEEGKEKTGVFSGVYAINPVNGQQIPIWIADYVLMGYGTGAIMAVPAHDQRDYDFARKYDLPIVEVVSGGDVEKEAYIGVGQLINSGEWNGWEVPEAKEQAIADLEAKSIGKKQVNYHLRDWLISRQRYWGAPIPMIYCQNCADKGDSWFTSEEAKNEKQKTKSIGNWKFEIGNSSNWAAGWYPEENLPVLLPKIDDYRPIGTGKAPLANHPEFYETICPACGSTAKRETDVSDTFLDSSWYFFRYPSTEIENEPWKSERVSHWMPVDQYIGGAEHSVLHLLYSRFVTKVFHDLGMIGFAEPFPKFFAHGLIIKEGAKMSKSKGNVVVPDEYIKKYGADTLRTYLMFLGPFSDGGDFQDTGIEGIHRFLKRVWTLFTRKEISGSEAQLSARVMMHRTIKGVSLDVASFRYNTAIAKIMTWYNSLSQQETITKEEMIVFLQLLAPFAPHMTEELYQRLGSEERKAKSEKFSSIHTSEWPKFDDSLLVDQTITIAVQVNGKLRDTLRIRSEQATDQAAIEEMAKKSEKVQKFIVDKDVKKVIYVPGKVLNLVL